MSQGSRLSRRKFVKTSAQTAAAVGLGTVMARSVRRTAAAEVRKIGANDRIHLGLIGCGSQGTFDTDQALNAANVACVALCDIADFRMDRTTGVVSKKMEEKSIPGVTIARYDDYRKLLEDKNIDAVVIATPDHWHYRPFMAALEAGKHIYQEKPFSYTYQLGQEMVAAAKKRPELTIQIGTQRRSGKHYHEAKALIDEGYLGKITRVWAFDTRNWFFGGDPFFPKELPQGKIDWEKFEEPSANKHPYDPYRYFTWRWYWDYAGGLVTDVGIHVMDAVHWLTGKTEPRSAVCNGGVYVYDKWETPDTVEAVWDYGTHMVTFTSSFLNERATNGFKIYGTHRTMEVLDEDVKVWEEGKLDAPVKDIPRDIECHRQNWIKAIRGEAKVNAPVELGASSLLPSHMANMAYKAGKKLKWDPQAMKVVE